jgi:hypothetical protein
MAAEIGLHQSVAQIQGSSMNTKSIQVVVMSAGQPACRSLGAWLGRHGLDWRYGSQDYGIDLARNQNITRFLNRDVSAGKTHLLMIDHDMVPVPATAAILESDGDLFYCGYVDRFGTPGHFGDNNFGAACFRASADLLNRMQRPWFATGFHDGRRVRCECFHFAALATACGAQSRMAGIIGHEQHCVLLPGISGAAELHWPPEFDEDGRTN